MAADRKLRDRGIVEARQAGESAESVAKRFRCSVRTVRRVVEQARRGLVDLDALDADEALQQAVRVHIETIQELGRLGRSGGHVSARVGALRSRAATSRDLIQLLAWAGYVPDRPAAWRLRQDLRRFASDLNALMAGVERGMVEREHLGVFLARVTGQPELPPVKDTEVETLVARLVHERAAA